jgi:glycosyltransferase involved in cell wall biosynthesis
MNDDLSALVSIGIPVYNGANSLTLVLDNLLSQSFNRFKILISDNCSEDKTSEICEKFASLDRRVAYYRQPFTSNPTKNFKFVLEKSDTPYFMWAAHDDNRDKNYIEELLYALERNQEAVLAFGDVVQYIDGTPVPLQLDFATRGRSMMDSLRWSALSPLHHLYGLWRTEALRRVDWRHTNWWHDTPLMMAACLLGDFIHVPGVRLHYLYNEHSFFDWTSRSGWRGRLDDLRCLGGKARDLAHLVLVSGVTVGKMGGSGYGLAGSYWAGVKVWQQISGFILRRLTGRQPPHRSAGAAQRARRHSSISSEKGRME